MFVRETNYLTRLVSNSGALCPRAGTSRALLYTAADIYKHTRTEAEEATETLARVILGHRGLTVAESLNQVN